MADLAIILNGVQGVEGSNPFIPTRNYRDLREIVSPFFVVELTKIVHKPKHSDTFTYFLYILLLTLTQNYH